MGGPPGRVGAKERNKRRCRLVRSLAAACDMPKMGDPTGAGVLFALWRARQSPLFDLTPARVSCLNQPVAARNPPPALWRNRMYLSADMSDTLNRILDAATNNLRIANILIQMGLDPDNVTWDAI